MAQLCILSQKCVLRGSESSSPPMYLEYKRTHRIALVYIWGDGLHYV